MRLMLLIFTFIFLSLTPSSEIKILIEKDLPYLVEFYKIRHQHPEISLQEQETARVLAAELRKIGFEVTENFGGYGIVGILKNGEGLTVLYRTDMDALPINEKTDLPYSSKASTTLNGEQVGAMHACGHDMHMTTWLGTARAMVALKKNWKGTLMLIGQPAEEIGVGAKAMLDKGLYEQFGVPDYGIGLHCHPTIPAGQIGIAAGFTMATADFIDLTIYGVGAHGATPEQSIDPVVIASMIVMELQTIISRNLKPTEAAVITVGSFRAGAKHNIIPDEAKLQLTVRTFSDDTRAFVHRRIQEVATGIAISAGVPPNKMPKFELQNAYIPSNYNHPDLVEKIKQSAAKQIEATNIVDAEQVMIGEDFACYGRTKEKVPTVLFWLGTLPKELQQAAFKPGLHSPFYYPNIEQSLTTGVQVTTQTLLDLLKVDE